MTQATSSEFPSRRLERTSEHPHGDCARPKGAEALWQRGRRVCPKKVTHCGAQRVDVGHANGSPFLAREFPGRGCAVNARSQSALVGAPRAVPPPVHRTAPESMTEGRCAAVARPRPHKAAGTDMSPSRGPPCAKRYWPPRQLYKLPRTLDRGTCWRWRGTRPAVATPLMHEVIDPNDSATAATEAPSSAQAASTCALNAAPCRRRCFGLTSIAVPLT